MTEKSRLQRFKTDFCATENVICIINILIGFDCEEAADTSRSREVHMLSYLRTRFSICKT